jgi:integrase
MQKMISAVLLRERVLIFLDMVTGLRRGELAGLKWADTDFLNLQIDVSRSVVDQHILQQALKEYLAASPVKSGSNDSSQKPLLINHIWQRLSRHGKFGSEMFSVSPIGRWLTAQMS